MSSDFSCKTSVRARKARTCPECCQRILPGQRYMKLAGNNDGDFYHHTHCIRCEELTHVLFRAQRQFGYNWDECTYRFNELLDEAVQLYYEDGWDALPEMRGRPFIEVGEDVRELLLINISLLVNNPS